MPQITSAYSYSVNISCYYNHLYLEFRVTDMTTNKFIRSKLSLKFSFPEQNTWLKQPSTLSRKLDQSYP